MNTKVLFAGLCLLVAGAAQAQPVVQARDIENPDRFPYWERGSAAISPNILNNFILFPTPVGRRYFIEFVAVQCTTPSATDSFPQVLLGVTKTITANSANLFSMPIVKMEYRGPGPFGGYVWAGHGIVKAISDASPFDAAGGSGVTLNIFHTDTSVTVNCTGTLMGHSLTL